MNQKDDGTQVDRGRDGGTNFILRIMEQETGLTLQEHDNNDDDDDDDDDLRSMHIKQMYCGCRIQNFLMFKLGLKGVIMSQVIPLMQNSSGNTVHVSLRADAADFSCPEYLTDC